MLDFLRFFLLFIWSPTPTNSASFSSSSSSQVSPAASPLGNLLHWSHPATGLLGKQTQVNDNVTQPSVILWWRQPNTCQSPHTHSQSTPPVPGAPAASSTQETRSPGLWWWVSICTFYFTTCSWTCFCSCSCSHSWTCFCSCLFPKPCSLGCSLRLGLPLSPGAFQDIPGPPHSCGLCPQVSTPVGYVPRSGTIAFITLLSTRYSANGVQFYLVSLTYYLLLSFLFPDLPTRFDWLS